MKLCRVLGTVTSTAKDEAYAGLTLLVVEPVLPDGRSAGASFLAVDRVQAGEGDLVLVMQEGNGVRQLFQKRPNDHFPVRSIIVGVVDHVEHAP
ncbi:MAG TPA: EutN/CcmL family microcompartment protein [Myxococcota bacterium]|nr:EutN/CcmL family microcompartment protein [Myxococcota bacterium]